MFCRKCWETIEDGTKFCPYCGAEQTRTITALLAFFLGGLGAHRFYVGKNGTAVLQILLTFCFGIDCIWAFVDLIVILCGNFRDNDNKLILDWEVKY